jgi:predicted Holliday junction resolvase-like endonuclease
MINEVILGLICLSLFLLWKIFEQNKKLSMLLSQNEYHLQKHASAQNLIAENQKHIQHFLQQQNTLQSQNSQLENQIAQQNQRIENLESEYQEKFQKSFNRSKYILRGQIAEKFCPFQPDFPYDAKDLVFLGNSVDYMVFKNLNHFRDTGENIDQVEIVFLEIKTGNAQLNEVQQAIRLAIENKRVSFAIYNPDRENQEALQIIDFKKQDQALDNTTNDSHILKQRETFARHSFKWSSFEEQILVEKYHQRYSLSDLSYMFQRKEQGIRTRLAKLLDVVEID